MSAAKNKPPFLPKLRQLIESSSRQVVRWNDEGTIVEVLDRASFETEIAKYYAGTAQTFVRQLHMYGFHKSDRVDSWSFNHKNFTRDRPDLQDLIERKHQVRTPRSRQPRPTGDDGQRAARRVKRTTTRDDDDEEEENEDDDSGGEGQQQQGGQSEMMDNESTISRILPTAEDQQQQHDVMMLNRSTSVASNSSVPLQRRVYELELQMREMKEQFASFRRQQDNASALLALGGGNNNNVYMQQQQQRLPSQRSQHHHHHQHQAPPPQHRMEAGQYATSVLLAQQLQQQHQQQQMTYDAAPTGLSPFSTTRSINGSTPMPPQAYAYSAPPINYYSSAAPKQQLQAAPTLKSIPTFDKPILDRSISAGSMMSNIIDNLPFEDNASVATADIMRELSMGFDHLDDAGFHDLESVAPEEDSAAVQTQQTLPVSDNQQQQVTPPPGACSEKQCPKFSIPEDFVLAPGVTASMLKRTFDVIKAACCPNPAKTGAKELWSLCNSRPCPTVLPPVEQCPVAQALLPLLREKIPDANVSDLHRMRAVRQIYEIFYANSKVRNPAQQQQPQVQTKQEQQQQQHAVIGA